MLLPRFLLQVLLEPLELLGEPVELFQGFIDLAALQLLLDVGELAEQILLLLHRFRRFPVQVLVLDPLRQLRHPRHEILDPLAQPLHFGQQLALGLLVLGLAQLLPQPCQLAPGGGQLLAQLLHRIQAGAIEQVLQIEDVFLLLADLRLQRAVEGPDRAVARRRSSRERRPGEARAVHRRTEPGRGITERAAQGLRGQLVLEQLSARRVQLLRQGAGVTVFLGGLRVPLGSGVHVRRRGLLLQAIAEQCHQPLPEGLGADQRLPAVLCGGEYLDRLRGRDASLWTVYAVVVLCLEMVADAIARPQVQEGDLPGVRAAQPAGRRCRRLQDHALFLGARALPEQRHLREPVIVGC